MSYLVALSFDDTERAAKVRDRLQGMQKEHLIDMADAAVVVRKDNGKVRLHQTHDTLLTGAVGGAFWGTLVGLIFMAPIIGLGVGLASGAIAGAVTDIGIDDDFMKTVGRTLQPGSSALFVLVRQATLDKVLDELRPYAGHLIHTSLSQKQEDKLRRLVEEMDGKQAGAEDTGPASNATTPPTHHDAAHL